MKAFKRDYMPLKEVGLGGILVEPTADPIRLRDELFEAIGIFWAPASSGSALAFRTTAQDPDINQATKDALATYFSEHRGERYSPQVDEQAVRMTNFPRKWPILTRYNPADLAFLTQRESQWCQDA